MNQEKREHYELRPIGFVRVSEGEFRLDILEPYRPALHGLKHFSHVKVFWWADQCDNEADRERLQTELPYADSTTVGVFACRSEYRPNPLAVTTCYILGVDEEAGSVQLAWIDAFDGTPLLDLKAFYPVSDRPREAHYPEWLSQWPDWMEDGAAFFAQWGAAE